MLEPRELISTQAFRQIKSVISLLGRKACIFIIASAIASLALVGIEYGLSSLLVSFLASVDLISSDATALGGAARIDLSPGILCALLIAAAILRAIGQVVVSYGGYLTGDYVYLRLRALCLFEMFLIKPNRYINNGLLNLRMGEIFPRTVASIQTGVLFILGILQCVGIAAVMFSVAWKVAMLVFIISGCTGLALYRLSRKVRAAAAQAPIAQASLFYGIQRTARNWLLIRVYRLAKVEYDHLVQSVLLHSSSLTRVSFLGNLNAAITPFLGILTVVGIVMVNQRFWQTPPAALVIFLYLLVRLVATLSTSILYSVTTFQCRNQFSESFKYFNSFSSEDRARAVEEVESSGIFTTVQPSNIMAAQQKSISSSSAISAAPNILIRDVDFAYSKGDSPILKNINCSIPSGEHVGIVGPSGSGKSTLMALILGILEPIRGRIEVYGELPASYFAKYSFSVGYVGAVPFLVEGTIRENLLYGNPNPIDDGELLAMLRITHLDNVIANLPKKLDHMISENGEGLSAGQKQRISLARSLLRKPKLLILDEPSANVDDDTEAHIASAIHDLKQICTVVIVSHREGMLRQADRVFSFQDKTLKLVEHGD